MELSTLLQSIAQAVSDDADIETYCQTNFGKSIAIIVHLDPKNPPGVAKAPFCFLTVQTYLRPTEHNANILTFTLDSAVCIESSGQTVSGKITTLDGFAKIESLSDIVFSAIEKAVSTAPAQLNMSYISESSTDFLINDFPSFTASRSFDIGKRF